MLQAFDGQYDDEEVELVFRQHIIAIRKALVIWSVILLAGALPLAVAPLWKLSWYSFFAGIIIGSLYFAYRWMSWYFSIYIVTDQRIVHIEQNGFFRRQVVELGHDKIQNVNYEIPGFQASIFKYGTITIQTYVGDLILDMIYHPEQTHRQISQIVRDHQPSGMDPYASD